MPAGEHPERSDAEDADTDHRDSGTQASSAPGTDSYEVLRARALALSGRDFRMTMVIATDMAQVLADRNRPRDLDAAWDLLVDTLRTATAGGMSEVKLLRDMGDFQ